MNLKSLTARLLLAAIMVVASSYALAFPVKYKITFTQTYRAHDPSQSGYEYLGPRLLTDGEITIDGSVLGPSHANRTYSLGSPELAAVLSYTLKLDGTVYSFNPSYTGTAVQPSFAYVIRTDASGEIVDLQGLFGQSGAAVELGRQGYGTYFDAAGPLLSKGTYTISRVSPMINAESRMIIPVVAQTSSYTSEISVRNPYSDMALPISVFYTGATTTSAAGRRACTPLTLPPLGSVQFSLATQCNLPSGNQFGYVTLVDSAGMPSLFQAYSRTQTPSGNGFSVPAYPVGAIQVPEFGHYVIGLKRQAAPPTYQSNCFVASTDDPTPYQIRLYDSAGNQIGNAVTGNLHPNQMVRYLDIFTAAGLPAGDYSNVSAAFSSGVSSAELIGFCTVQENTFFGADFRLAQP